MIKRCKYVILNFRVIKETKKGGKIDEIISSDGLWEFKKYPPSELIPMLQSCIDLNLAYQKQYDQTK